MSKAINRGSLYVTIAVLTYLQSALKPEMGAHDWTMLVIGSLLAGAVTLRAFIDQTPTDTPQKVEVTNTPNQPVPVDPK